MRPSSYKRRLSYEDYPIVRGLLGTIRAEFHATNYLDVNRAESLSKELTLHRNNNIVRRLRLMNLLWH